MKPKILMCKSKKAYSSEPNYSANLLVQRNRDFQAFIIWGLFLLLLLIDQGIKFWTKQTLLLGDEIKIFDWFSIYFVENAGMAYGLEIGSKLFLSIFRIIVMSALCLGIFFLSRSKKFSVGFLLTLVMIAAGGIGNIIDCAFYGLIFSDSSSQIASLFPIDGGYAPFLEGKVVDMFYFPLIDCTLPNWLPIWGGENFTFFDPVFNFADSCISVGVALLFLFYKKSFNTALNYIFSSKKDNKI